VTLRDTEYSRHYSTDDGVADTCSDKLVQNLNMQVSSPVQVYKMTRRNYWLYLFFGYLSTVQTFRCIY